MPAKRKTSDAQREAIFRLHEGGLSSKAIARACEDGRTGLARFEISDRTVRDIIDKMGKEAHRRLPTSVLDLERGEAMARFPARAARILDAELDRLEAKQRKNGLTEKEVDRIPKLVISSSKVARVLQERGGERKARGAAGESAGTPHPEETALERLAREQQERGVGEEQLTPTRTCHDEALKVKPAIGPIAPQTPRELAARRARAALAGSAFSGAA